MSVTVAAANSCQFELDALGQARTLEALYRSAEAAASAPVADWSSA
jgi:hypothetical protein